MTMTEKQRLNGFYVYANPMQGVLAYENDLGTLCEAEDISLDDIDVLNPRDFIDLLPSMNDHDFAVTYFQDETAILFDELELNYKINQA